jgi:hypothetical protein
LSRSRFQAIRQPINQFVDQREILLGLPQRHTLVPSVGDVIADPNESVDARPTFFLLKQYV